MRATHALVAVAVIGSATPAAAVEVAGSNPLAASPWSTGFEDPDIATWNAVVVTLDDGAGNQILVAGSPITTTEVFYLQGDDPALAAWDLGCGTDCGAVRLTFVPAVDRAAIRIRQCTGATVGATVSGAAGAETLAPVACLAEQWIVADGAAGGPIDALVIRGNQIIVDDLFVAESAPPLDANLALDAVGAMAVAGATVAVELITTSTGPSIATAVALDVLGEEGGVTSPDTAPPGHREDLGDLAAGAVVTTQIAVTAPEAFDCHDPILLVGLVRAAGVEPDVRDNVGLVWVSQDPAARLDREVCHAGGDEDCDGSYGCADPDCDQAPGCPGALTWVDIADGNLPWGWFPLPMPPFAVGDDDGPTPPALPDLDAPRPARSCSVYVNGMARSAPLYCCEAAPRPGAPLWTAYQRDCPPRDPNAKEADPPTSARGVGLTAAGEEIRYTLHYENVGATDAHDVQVIDRLDEALDDTTLVIEDGGSYDAATRTLTWVDPEVWPSDPREVHYRVRVRADAPVGTRIRNVATIVFPDAVPPTRIDTNAVEHVIPPPDLAVRPELFVEGCTAEGVDTWRVRLQNRGVVGGYNVTARAVAWPDHLDVSEGEARFAHDDDPAPDELASVPPLATSVSVDPVTIVGAGGVDPCREMTWALTFTGLGDAAATTVTVRTHDDVAPTAPDDAAGCCAAASGRGAAGAGLLTLLVGALLRRRSRR